MILSPLFMTSFCCHCTGGQDPPVQSYVGARCAKQFSGRKKALGVFTLRSGSDQHSTRPRHATFLPQQPSKGRPGSMPNNAVRPRVLLSRRCPGDKNARGFMGDILTLGSINTLLLMDYGVLLHTHSARRLKMKCYTL